MCVVSRPTTNQSLSQLIESPLTEALKTYAKKKKSKLRKKLYMTIKNGATKNRVKKTHYFNNIKLIKHKQ